MAGAEPVKCVRCGGLLVWELLHTPSSSVRFLEGSCVSCGAAIYPDRPAHAVSEGRHSLMGTRFASSEGVLPRYAPIKAVRGV
jgi:hypothetical protein